MQFGRNQIALIVTMYAAGVIQFGFMLRTGRVPWHVITVGLVAGFLIVGPLRWLSNPVLSNRGSKAVIFVPVVVLLILTVLSGGDARLVLTAVFIGVLAGGPLAVSAEATVIPARFRDPPE